MNTDFQKTCGSFTIEGHYGGFPEWHSITYKGVELRHLVVEDLRDLAYAIERAIAHHALHGHKAGA